MPVHVCATTNCPELVPPPHRRCPEHRAQHERDRGTTTQRGYGTPHRQLRRAYANDMTNGITYLCPRCGYPIDPTQPWDLGHIDGTRDQYSGPEHARGPCNRATTTHRAQGYPPPPTPGPEPTGGG